MTVTRTLAAAVVGLSLTASVIVLSEAMSDPPAADSVPTMPASSGTFNTSGDVATAAADKAVLVAMCRAGLNDPEASNRYQSTAAAHPELASDIRPDCSLPMARP